jgi:hypothetical protein
MHPHSLRCFNGLQANSLRVRTGDWKPEQGKFLDYQAEQDLEQTNLKGRLESPKSAPHSHSIEPIMSKPKSTFDDLFGETSLFAWKRRLDGGEIPPLAQIADIIEANKNEPFPDWFVEHLCNRLRSPDKPKRGRPSLKESYKDWFARCLYQVELAKFQAERKSALASGQKRAKSGRPPNELAARYIQKAFYQYKTWRAVLNMMSSRNAPSRK